MVKIAGFIRCILQLKIEMYTGCWDEVTLTVTVTAAIVEVIVEATVGAEAEVLLGQGAGVVVTVKVMHLLAAKRDRRDLMRK